MQPRLPPIHRKAVAIGQLAGTHSQLGELIFFRVIPPARGRLAFNNLGFAVALAIDNIVLHASIVDVQRQKASKMPSIVKKNYSFPSPITPRKGRSSPWAQPILHNEQREFFSPSEPPFFVPGICPPPLGIRFMSPCAPRTASRLPGFRFVLFLYEGLAPLAIAMPPLPGLLSSRGFRRGELPHCSLCIVYCALPCSLRRMPPSSPQKKSPPCAPRRGLTSQICNSPSFLLAHPNLS